MNQDYFADSYAPVKQTNGLAIAGFVFSLVGIVATTGLLCPVGLIISIIALGKPYGRGWATAGIILGIVGTCGWFLLWAVLGVAILAALGIGVAAAFLAINDPERLEMTIDMATISEAIQREERVAGYLPATLSTLRLESDTLTDPWGKEYIYTFVDVDEDEKPEFDLVSAGPDGTQGTEDDFSLSKLDDYWENYFELKEDADGNIVSIRLGQKSVNLECDEETGRVTIDLGDRKVNIVDDGKGGRISVTQKPPIATESEDPTPEPDESTEQ